MYQLSIRKKKITDTVRKNPVIINNNDLKISGYIRSDVTGNSQERFLKIGLLLLDLCKASSCTA